MKKKAEEKSFYMILNRKTRRHVTKGNLHELPFRRVGLLTMSIFLAACSAVRATTDKAAQLALETVGIRAPESSAQAAPARTIRIRLDAARDLNADEDGKGLSAIVRLYKLRDKNAFLSAPYAVFGHLDREKQAFGADMMEAHELILTPGQQIDLAEKMSAETPYLGVATLFRTPDSRRWRFAFAGATAEAAGITLGVHGCAMTATTIAPLGMTLSDAALLSSVKCN
ncbi:MAG: type VI secretion system lipoprotein TssJ [Bacillota bacterium]